METLSYDYFVMRKDSPATFIFLQFEGRNSQLLFLRYFGQKVYEPNKVLTFFKARRAIPKKIGFHWVESNYIMYILYMCCIRKLYHSRWLSKFWMWFVIENVFKLQTNGNKYKIKTHYPITQYSIAIVDVCIHVIEFFVTLEYSAFKQFIMNIIMIIGPHPLGGFGLEKCLSVCLCLWSLRYNSRTEHSWISVLGVYTPLRSGKNEHSLIFSLPYWKISKS